MDVKDYLSDENLYGKDFANKRKAFDRELLEIEKKHIDYFKERKPLQPNEELERLYNHYITTNMNGRFTFNFSKDSDLPSYIQAECNKAFQKIFNESK